MDSISIGVSCQPGLAGWGGRRRRLRRWRVEGPVCSFERWIASFLWVDIVWDRWNDGFVGYNRDLSLDIFLVSFSYLPLSRYRGGFYSRYELVEVYISIYTVLSRVHTFSFYILECEVPILYMGRLPFFFQTWSTFLLVFLRIGFYSLLFTMLIPFFSFYDFNTFLLLLRCLYSTFLLSW